MPDSLRRQRLGPARHPVHALLGAYPLVCFTGALVTDIAYANTADMQWANFSVWLLAAGLVIGALAVLAGAAALLRDPVERRLPGAWVHTGGNVVVMLLALWNVFVHSRDAWTSVVPIGLILSVLTLVAMVATGWLGGAMLRRERLETVR